MVPLLCGLFVTRIGMAIMGGLNEAFQLDALALNMLTMIGLALGVDYSLLIVSRFREELAAGRSVEEAVEQSVLRAGRTVVFAGTALAVGMLGAFFIAPGSLLESATLGVVVACVLAVVIGLFAIPAEPRRARHERGPLAAVVRPPREPVGAAVRAHVAQADGRGAAHDVPAAAADGARAGTRHRSAQRRRTCRPTTRTRKSFEAFQRDRGRRLGDAVRGRLPDPGTDHDGGAAARA